MDNKRKTRSSTGAGAKTSSSSENQITSSKTKATTKTTETKSKTKNTRASGKGKKRKIDDVRKYIAEPSAAAAAAAAAAGSSKSHAVVASGPVICGTAPLIKRIMQDDPNTAQVGADAIQAMARATDAFLQDLGKRLIAIGSSRLDIGQLRSCLDGDEKLDFLQIVWKEALSEGATPKPKINKSSKSKSKLKKKMNEATTEPTTSEITDEVSHGNTNNNVAVLSAYTLGEDDDQSEESLGGVNNNNNNDDYNDFD